MGLQHVLKIGKTMIHKQELIDCGMDELNNLEQVSKNMINSLESPEDLHGKTKPV